VASGSPAVAHLAMSAVWAPGLDAEMTAIKDAGNRGLTPSFGVNNNNVCDTCAETIEDMDGTVNGREYHF
jgi:hypothetical protein